MKNDDNIKSTSYDRTLSFQNVDKILESMN